MCPKCSTVIPWASLSFVVKHLRGICLSYPHRFDCTKCRAPLTVRYAPLHWIVYLSFMAGTAYLMGYFYRVQIASQFFVFIASLYMLCGIVLICGGVHLKIPMRVENKGRAKFRER
ncbi:MAG: hypothetical protein A2Z83_02925 [Omnitrophica bacterium GWA2_52_8]|nr:MAG: hypothetical protein A2Z83_02925 [Omnitrophica bacterium GWA2_52_8]